MIPRAGFLFTVDQVRQMPLYSTSLARPMGATQFKTGFVNSMEFDLNGGDYKMNGTLKLLLQGFSPLYTEKG